MTVRTAPRVVVWDVACGGPPHQPLWWGGGLYHCLIWRIGPKLEGLAAHPASAAVNASEPPGLRRLSAGVRARSSMLACLQRSRWDE